MRFRRSFLSAAAMLMAMFSGYAGAVVTPTDSTRSFYDLTGGDVWRVGRSLVYQGYQGAAGYELMRLDIDTGRVSMLKDVLPGVADGVSPDGLRCVCQGKLYFMANTASGGQMLWSSDGSSAGTSAKSSLWSQLELTDGDVVAAIACEGSRLFLVSRNAAATIYKLWHLDVDSEDALLVKDAMASAPAIVGDVGGITYFRSGSVVWSTDGGADSAVAVSGAYFPDRTALLNERFLLLSPDTLLRQVDPDSGETTSLGVSFPYFTDVLSRIGHRLFFNKAGESHDQLWVTDGSIEGTVELTDRLPSYSNDALVLGDRLLYAELSESGVMSLNSTDGTLTGEVELFTMSSTEDFYSVRYKNAVNTAFVAKHSACCVSIWKTDGTAAGSVKVLEQSRAPGKAYYLLGGDDDRFFIASRMSEPEEPDQILVYSPAGTSAGDSDSGAGGSGGSFDAALLSLLATLLFFMRKRQQVG